MANESASDIRRYLKIVGSDAEPVLTEASQPVQSSIDLGVSTRGVSVGQTYTYDNGLKWLKVISEDEQVWCCEVGLLEYQSHDVIAVSKVDLSQMVRTGEVVLHEATKASVEVLSESSTNKLFESWKERVDRYMLVNYGIESGDCDFSWEEAFENGLQPSEAADEAVL